MITHPESACLQPQHSAAAWGKCVSAVCMMCTLLCACFDSTLTCSLASTMGLLHDEANTKLSMEQLIDLKSQSVLLTVALLPFVEQVHTNVTWQSPVSKH